MSLSNRIVDVHVPQGAIFRHFGAQGDDLFIWMEIEALPIAVPEARQYKVVGTGHSIPDGMEYRATCQQGPFMWHLYEVG